MKTHALKSNVARARVLALALKNDECRRFVSAGASQTATADGKLVDLFVMGGLLGSYLHDRDWQRNRLLQVYGFTTGWLMSLGVKAPVILIDAERTRQEKLFRAGKFNFTCASLTAGEPRKFRILAEEIGEVANALDRLEMINCMTNQKHLREELVQVAAVAVAWLEALEVNK